MDHVLKQLTLSCPEVRSPEVEAIYAVDINIIRPDSQAIPVGQREHLCVCGFLSVILYFQGKVRGDIMEYGFHSLFDTLKYICITLINSLVPISPTESGAIIILLNQVGLRDLVHHLCEILLRFHRDNMENVIALTCIFPFFLIQMSLPNIA